MRWPDTDLAYMAGIIDGEGSISVFRSGASAKKQRDYLMLNVYNTNLDLLSWVAGTFGGRINAIPRKKTPNSHKWKQEYSWSGGQRHAASVLAACLPYLKIKKRQAELFISHADTSIGRVGRPIPPGVVVIRAAIVREMKELNKKGVTPRS